MSALINYLVSYALNNPAAVLTLLGSGTGVAVVLQVIKHYGKLQDAKKTVMVLLAVLSTGASFVDQLLGFANEHTALLALHNLGWIIATAVFMHRFFVSPSYYGILKGLNTLNQAFTDANAYRAEKAALAASAANIAGIDPTGTAAAAPDPTQHEFTIQ